MTTSPRAQLLAQSSIPDGFLGRTMTRGSQGGQPAASTAAATVMEALPAGLLDPPDYAQPKVALATQPLHVNGNRVVYSNGRAFIPYGTSLVGGPEQWQWARVESAVTAQIEASAQWGANTVRVQAAPANLFADPTPGMGYNVQFQSELQREADLARSLGMRFVLHDQAQCGLKPSSLPTSQT